MQLNTNLTALNLNLCYVLYMFCKQKLQWEIQDMFKKKYEIWL